MLRRTFLWLTLLGLVTVPALAQQKQKVEPPRNIILIGWDGAQREHLQQCLQRGELPNLKKLIEEGALVNIDVITGATDTKAGWTQILTGYHPEVTGVYSNGRYRDVPAGLSIFERLKEHFGKDFVCVAVIGKSGHCGEINPPFKVRVDESGKPLEPIPTAGKPGVKQPGYRAKKLGKIVEENGVKYLVFQGSPYYTMHKACDVWEYGLVQDERVGTRALELLEKYKDKPFFFFVHFAEVDHSGHRHGENSKEYNDALISADKWTGKIMAKLKELGLYDKTLIYVTADHGFDEGQKSHRYAPYVFLATNDPMVKRDGMRQDIAPTILARFGLDLSKFDPPLDGEPLTQPPTKPVLKAPPKKVTPQQKKQPQQRQQKKRRAKKKAA